MFVRCVLVLVDHAQGHSNVQVVLMDIFSKLLINAQLDVKMGNIYHQGYVWYVVTTVQFV